MGEEGMKKVEEGILLDGVKLGQWVVLRRLGGGAFGDVYWIAQAKSKETVMPWDTPPIRLQAAMKVSPEDDPTKQLHFERQALEHMSSTGEPGFTKLLDYGKGRFTKKKDSDTFNWIAIELIGVSFDKLEGKLTKGCAIESILQLLKRIEALHKSFYVHRDLKPANCGVGLVPYQHIVYLLDFGMCKRLTDQRGALRHGQNVNRGIRRGTPDYMPIAGHNGRETVPLDEVESWWYAAIKIVIGTVPWEGKCRNEEDLKVYKKRFMTDEDHAKEVLASCPPEFMEIWRLLGNMLGNKDKELKPDYKKIYAQLEKAQKKFPPKYDWEWPKGQKGSKKLG